MLLSPCCSQKYMYIMVRLLTNAASNSVLMPSHTQGPLHIEIVRCIQ